MRCKICGQESSVFFTEKVLAKYDVDYFYCDRCGFMQTEEPYWLEEAYGDSINISDTGYMARNLYLTKVITILLFLFSDKKGSFLDYAGGYGVFVRMMRDVGFDFYWDDKYTQNLFARGFEYDDDKKVEAVTTFESFEHFVDPVSEIGKIFTISKNIIFTTEIFDGVPPKPNEWAYYGFKHGQHISFYQEKTLRFIADSFGVNYSRFGDLHIFTDKVIASRVLKVLKLHRIGLHKMIGLFLKSKTLDDFEKLRR